MKVAINSYMTPYSGIGVMQRELYPRLEAMGHELLPLPTRQPTDKRVSAYKNAVLATRQALPPGAERFLSLVTPLTREARVPTTTVIHDLRWQRTRSGVGRLYRQLDLKNTVRTSAHLVAISERTASDVRALFPNASVKVAHPGPGQIEGGDFAERARRNILLIGRAPHKRNGLAADIIRQLPPDWFDGVVGVNIDPEIATRLSSDLGSDRCEWHYNVDRTQLAELYRRSFMSLQLSEEEGFGMPFIEAMTSGTIVAAIDQPLTREILGVGAVLLAPGSSAALARQLEVAPLPPAAVRQSISEKYSWDAFAAVFNELLSKP